MPEGALLEPVVLSEAARTGRGLLANALPLPSGWEGGVRFHASGCSEPEVVAPCVVLETGINPVDVVEFRPTLVRQTASCATLTSVGLEDRAQDRLLSTTEWALGRSLADATAVGSTNPSLADAISVSAAANVVDAVSCLEQAIADTAFGGRGFLHAPARAAAYLADHNLIDENGWSPAGHRWIISSGYPAEAELVTLWATGSVWAAAGDIESLDEPGWRTNTAQPFRQRYVLAAFDPCVNLSTTFAVAECVGGS